MIDDLGTYVQHAGRPAVRFTRTYAHPVERVWAALTEPDQTAAWFPSRVDLEPRAGGTVTFRGDPRAGDTTGTVLAFEPPHRLAFTWFADELHLTLEPTGPGECRLTLLDVLADERTAARTGAGWHVCLGELRKLLDGRPTPGPHSPSAQPWPPVYESYLAAGLPSGAPIPDAANH